MSTIAELKTEIETKATEYWNADAAGRATFYTLGAASVLSEADARALTSKPYFITLGDGTKLKIVPKDPQRKSDGYRGAQMNFWLYDDQKAYHQKFNLHVNIVSLEQKHKAAILAEQAKEAEESKEAAFELQPDALKQLAFKRAKAERKKNKWLEFKVKSA